MAQALVPLFGPVPGGMEMVVILLIAVLLFGANKIPKLARSTGQAMGEFQRGREEIEQELEEVQEGATTTSSDDESTLGSDETTSDLDTESESTDDR
jgi:sec-independent protein translocase protein TatA